VGWHKRLAELEIELPEVPTPSGAYVLGVVTGGLLYVSGQTWKHDGVQTLVGRVGAEVSVEEAAQSARHAALACIAEAAAILGDLERVARLVRVGGFVRSAKGFDRQPAVIDGASTVLLEIFGPAAGGHARTSVGVAELPGGAAVEIDVIFSVRD
jgi:enamine deaminase RidA (YjgF/YER057c/UK114 family)